MGYEPEAPEEWLEYRARLMRPPSAKQIQLAEDALRIYHDNYPKTEYARMNNLEAVIATFGKPWQPPRITAEEYAAIKRRGRRLRCVKRMVRRTRKYWSREARRTRKGKG